MSSADAHLRRLVDELGLQLPPFRGPLEVFVPDAERGDDDPIYLGGDLHAVHPEASDCRPGLAVDRSLDGAEVIVTDFENEPVEALAVEGIWCMRLQGPMLDAAPYFGITDGEGRRRIWLLLPPAHLLIGLGHCWLPSVPPLPRAGRRADRDR